MLRYRTEGFSGCSVKYSPFFDSRLAVGGSSNFGLVGNGRLYILDIAEDATIKTMRTFDTQDNIAGLSWSEVHENQVITANGDGKARLFDVTTPQPFPIQVYGEHTRDVFSVDWGLVDKGLFCTASWDGTIKVWNPQRTVSLATLQVPDAAHGGQPANVFCAKFAPHSATTILSGHGHGQARIWDTRTGAMGLSIPAVHGGDCLGVDWNKYEPNVIATGGVDKVVRVWDTRNLSSAVNLFSGHEYAVKSVKWSPHDPYHLLSTSYDMTAKTWVNSTSGPLPLVGHKGLVRDFTLHTEFVIDGDWSLWGEAGWLATVGWDQMLYIWKGFVH